MHGYIINGKRRHSAIFWLAVISVLVGLGLTYWIDLILSKLETMKGTQIIVLLYSAIFGVGSGAIFTLLYYLFDNFFWKIKIFGNVDLSGKYQCEGVSKDKSQKEKDRFTATIIIKQTWTKISVNLKTDKSYSDSFMAKISQNGVGDIRLDYCYTNNTDQTNKDMVSRHTGTATIIFSSEIKGKYYNQPDYRMRYGELVLSKEG
jgi:putative pancortin-3